MAATRRRRRRWGSSVPLLKEKSTTTNNNNDWIIEQSRHRQVEVKIFDFITHVWVFRNKCARLTARDFLSYTIVWGYAKLGKTCVFYNVFF